MPSSWRPAPTSRGGNTWSRFVDPTAPDGLSAAEGAIIGTGHGRVHAYQADERRPAGGTGPLFTYTVAALAADTGKVEDTRPGRDGQRPDRQHLRRPLTLVGDALYVPYGERSVYTVDVRNL